MDPLHLDGRLVRRRGNAPVIRFSRPGLEGHAACMDIHAGGRLLPGIGRGCG